MLVDAIYILIGTILNAIAALFGLLNFIVPTQQISNAFVFIFSYLNYLGGIIDIPTAMQILILLASFETIWYLYKLILFLIHAAPVIGNPKHPTT